MQAPSLTICVAELLGWFPDTWYGKGRPSGIEKRSRNQVGSAQVFVAEQPAWHNGVGPCVRETWIEMLPASSERVARLPADTHCSAAEPTRTHAVPEGSPVPETAAPAPPLPPA